MSEEQPRYFCNECNGSGKRVLFDSRFLKITNGKCDHCRGLGYWLDDTDNVQVLTRDPPLQTGE